MKVFKYTYPFAIESLYLKRKFMEPNDSRIYNHQAYKEILSAIDIDEFFAHCHLNASLPYQEAVKRACRQATMYVLYAVSTKCPSGKTLLQHLEVCDGKIGDTPHTWLVLGGEYIVDLTLAQFSPYSVPKMSVLALSDMEDIYEVNRLFTWKEWIDIETQLMN